MARTTTCASCGAVVSIEAEWCQTCGGRVRNKMDAAARSASPKRRVSLLGKTVIVLCVVALLLSAWWGGYSSGSAAALWIGLPFVIATVVIAARSWDEKRRRRFSWGVFACCALAYAAAILLPHGAAYEFARAGYDPALYPQTVRAGAVLVAIGTALGLLILALTLYGAARDAFGNVVRSILMPSRPKPPKPRFLRPNGMDR